MRFRAAKRLGKNVAAAFSAGHSTILLENHGACTAGATLQEAFKRFETLDFCARLILRASQLGTPHYLSDTEIEFSQLDRNIDFRPFDPEVRSSDEMELRYQMALLIRRAYKQMLFTSTEGTFAVRVDKERILITPRNVDRGNIQPEDMVLVKGMRYESGRKLSRAAWLFRAIFDAQPKSTP